MSLTPPSTTTSPFVPSLSGSYFVTINPNANTLNGVPLADGSPELLFAVFGQGSAVDLGALLLHAQERLHISAIDRHRTGIMLYGDGALKCPLVTLNRSIRPGLGSEPHSALVRGRVTINDIQLSRTNISEFKVRFPPPLTSLFYSPQSVFVRQRPEPVG